MKTCLIITPYFEVHEFQEYRHICRNTTKNQMVLFNIPNFSKGRSLFREGMTPVVKSTSRPKWCVGYVGKIPVFSYIDSKHFCYIRQRLPTRAVYYYKPQNAAKSDGYTLSFVFVFDRDQDTYFFAYCFPYTYPSVHNSALVTLWWCVRRGFVCRLESN